MLGLGTRLDSSYIHVECTSNNDARVVMEEAHVMIGGVSDGKDVWRPLEWLL